MQRSCVAAGLRAAIRCIFPSVEDVFELDAVAEAPQFGSERRSVSTVFCAGHVGDVRLPAAGLGSLGQSGAAAAADGRRVLVAVIALTRRVGAQQPLAA